MAEGILQFGDFELDRGAYQLRRKGHIVGLQRIPLDLLLFLVERRGQLVTREEIRKRIWGDEVFLDAESSINTAIRKLRRALRDRPGAPRFIDTVPAKGYRFIAMVREPAPKVVRLPRSKRAFTDHGPKISPIFSSQAGERRHLTVLVCELMNAASLELPDPEEWWEKVADYHRAAVLTIERYGGHVGPHRGDVMTVYFGWPAAHDNDAELAVRAGLAIIAAVARLNERPSHPKLHGRVGIDSGMVVAGARNGTDADIFGDVPSIAARVQSAAEPGTVLITGTTQRLVPGLFVVEKTGKQPEGVPSAIELFRVVRSTGFRRNLGGARRLTPFVGREEELQLLLSRWERTCRSEGQAALIIGEAGIGKSRLVAEFHDRIRHAPHIWIESAGEQFFGNTPFHAIIEMLSGWLELQKTANTDEQFERIRRALNSAGLKEADIAPLIGELLQLSASSLHSTSALTAEQKRRRLFAALSAWVFGAAKVQPLVMVIEDLHWLDPSTLELLQLLIEQGATVPVMLVCTARPEFSAPWPMRSHYSQVTLNRLSSRSVREMVASVAARDSLAADRVQAIVRRAAGVPLFVEELTRVVLEGDSAQGNGRRIPATLHDSLMARLDRLGPAKEVLQIAAVVGNEFSFELLHAVHPIPDEELQVALHCAADAELLYARGIPPQAIYQFKHALIRDAAYEALLGSRRKELHLRTAEALMPQSTDRVTTAPELLAHHYTEAGLVRDAIPHWHRAGQRAMERSANVEAISHFTRGLELLESISDSIERTHQELSLQMALGGSLMVIKGQAAPEAGNAYARALELCRRIGETPRLFPVLGALSVFHMARGQPQAARELLEQLLPKAEKLQARELLQSVHYGMGAVLFYLGELPQALTHLELAMTLYDPEKRRFPASEDPGVGSLGIAAFSLWALGYPDQARDRVQESLVLAQKLSYPFSISIALERAAVLSQRRREAEATQEQAEALIALADEQGFTLRKAVGLTLRGWALAKQGWQEEGIAQIRQGLAAAQGSGAGLWQPGLFAVLAETCGDAGQPEEGLTALEEAFDLASHTGCAIHEPGLYLLKGELVLRRSDFDTTQAERWFQRAIDSARKQSAKSWELRATTHLANLLTRQGCREEARSMLLEIYYWFTEGFDTPDLKDAKALLVQLAG